MLVEQRGHATHGDGSTDGLRFGGHGIALGLGGFRVVEVAVDVHGAIRRDVHLAHEVPFDPADGFAIVQERAGGAAR